MSGTKASIRIGRHTLYEAVASGAMARVYLGRTAGAAGVTRTVAIKRVHPQFVTDDFFVLKFSEAAWILPLIQHPNVVRTFDVVTQGDELLLVMDYIHGDSLASLLGLAKLRGVSPAPTILSGILGGVLAGLHAAHELRTGDGQPFHLVHGDVSPQNVLVGVDGVARVVDLGLARTMGFLEGKIAYAAPERLRGIPVDRRADVYSASVILWDALAGRKLFEADSPLALALPIMSGEIAAPSRYNAKVDAKLDAVVLKGLSRQVETRYPSAEAMAIDLAAAVPPAPPRVVSEWVKDLARQKLALRDRLVKEVEADPDGEGSR